MHAEAAELQIDTVDGRVAYAPLEKLELQVAWQLLEHRGGD